MNLSCCSITHVEIQGIVKGFQLIWSCSIRKMTIQSDSTTVAILSGGYNSLLDHQHAILVLHYLELYGR
ncbi:hypothetical protein LINGRAHAP2_LOCUS26163 [Linum grandiflorum]